MSFLNHRTLKFRYYPLVLIAAGAFYAINSYLAPKDPPSVVYYDVTFTVKDSNEPNHPAERRITEQKIERLVIQFIEEENVKLQKEHSKERKLK